MLGPQYDAVARTTTVTDTAGHGTCMLSVAGGRVSGVYKNAELIPIKVTETGATMAVMDVLAAMGTVLSLAVPLCEQTNADP